MMFVVKNEHCRFKVKSEKPKVISFAAFDFGLCPLDF